MVDLLRLKTGWGPIEQPDSFIYRKIKDEKYGITVAGNFHYACFQLLIGNYRIGLASFKALLNNHEENHFDRKARNLLAGKAEALFASLPTLRPRELAK